MFETGSDVCQIQSHLSLGEQAFISLADAVSCYFRFQASSPLVNTFASW